VECQEKECISVQNILYTDHENVRSALNHLQFKDANGGNGAFRKEDKANRYRSTIAIPENRIQLEAKALYTCQKFSERRIHSMHAQNSLPTIDPFYILQETNKNIFFSFSEQL